MKKSFVVVILAIATLALSSCSVYTCPTYAKAVKELPVRKARI